MTVSQHICGLSLLLHLCKYEQKPSEGLKTIKQSDAECAINSDPPTEASKLSFPSWFQPLFANLTPTPYINELFAYKRFNEPPFTFLPPFLWT